MQRNYEKMQRKAEKCRKMQINAGKCWEIKRNNVKCKEMQGNSAECSEMQRNEEKWREMQRNAVECSEMQINAEKCSEIQWNAEKCSSAPPNPRCRSRPLEPRRHSNIHLANISTAKWNYNHKHNFETRSEIYITYFTTRSTSLLPKTDIMKDTMTDQLCDARVSLHNSQSLQKADWDWSYDNHEIHTFCIF